MACLKLSNLQSDWKLVTWVCFYLALAGFWLTYEFAGRFEGEARGRRRRRNTSFARPVFRCMQVLTLISLSAFLFEAVLGVPHYRSPLLHGVLRPGSSSCRSLFPGRGQQADIPERGGYRYDGDGSGHTTVVCFQISADFLSTGGVLYLRRVSKEIKSMDTACHTCGLAPVLCNPDGGQEP